MRRSRGFTLIEALISILILSVVMIVALTLLVSMRSFAAKQQGFTAPRQSARSAVDYVSFFLAGATDLNVEAGNPNALVMWTTWGNSAGTTPRQTSYNNLDAGQVTAGFGDSGTDIISIGVPTNPVRIPVAKWVPTPIASKTMDVNFTTGCPDDAANLALFKQVTGATLVGAKDVSGVLTVSDLAGRWRYVQITDYLSSDCTAALGANPTNEVIHIQITPGDTNQLNPPGGWREDLVKPFTLNAGVDYTSFRVKNGSLEQKTSGFDAAGVYSPGIFNPDCDRDAPGGGCPTIGFTPVVENVEDLQIAYVFQNGEVWNTAVAGKVLGTGGSIPEQVATGTAVAGVYDVSNVRALRVSIRARSNPLDIGVRQLSSAHGSRGGLYQQPPLEDHPGGALDTVAGGVYDRFQLTTTLVLRNRMLGY
jgi:prepilin-type N-terminal cleavage/methylation domain-containing protein